MWQTAIPDSFEQHLAVQTPSWNAVNALISSYIPQMLWNLFGVEVMIIDRLLSDGCEAGMHLPTEISLVLRICSVAFLSISKKWYHLKALMG